MHGTLIGDLAAVTVVAAVTSMLAHRFGQSSILGYLLAGLIVGPYIPLPLFANPERMQELAEVGVVLVMFAVGLEFRIRRLIEILPASGLTACVQIAALSWAGFTFGDFLGWSTTASICLGATIAISSTMVVSAVLRSTPVDSDVRSNVFGVLIVQDVVAIVLMAVVTGFASGRELDFRSLGLLVGQLAGAIALMLVVALLILPRLVRYAVAQSDTEILVVLVAAAAFGLASAAHYLGYSVALGAFISGIAVGESGRSHSIEHAIEPLRSLFSAIFFVSIGMAVDPLVAWQNLPIALGLCVIVIGAQFLSVTVITVLTGSSLRRGIYTGIALGQIGELSFILATIGIMGGILPSEALPALVTVATITAFTTPMLLRRGQTIVDAVDRWLPDRAHNVLTAYQSFIRGMRNAESSGPSLKQPAFAVLLDWSALVVIFVLHHTLLPQVDKDLRMIVNAVALVVAVPFLLGLVRSGLKLSRAIHLLAVRRNMTASFAKAVEATSLLTFVIGIGFPTVSLIQPFLNGPWAEVMLLVVLSVALVLVGWRVGEIEGGHTSSVARLALDIEGRLQFDDAPLSNVLLTQPADDAAFDDDSLAGIDYAPVEIASGVTADGLTLAELDLRCRSGATVIAIRRGGVTTTLPTGHERLQAGDLLALSGSDESIDRAREILIARSRRMKD
ncbi:MAG: cation:proton antiporter [Polyangiales bacterium]